MASTTLGRLGGLASILAGVLFALGTVASYNTTTGSNALSWAEDLFILTPLLLLAAVGGLWAYCRGRTGRLGDVALKVSLVAFAAGSVSLFMIQWIEDLWFGFVLGTMVGLLALAVAGIAIIRTRALGSWSVLPTILSVYGIFALMTGDPPYNTFSPTVGLVLWVLFGLGWVLLGIALLTSRSSVAVPAAVS